MDSCKYTDSIIEHLMDFSTLKMAADVAQEPLMLVHLNNHIKSERSPYPSSIKIIEFNDDEKLAEENHMVGVIDKYKEHLQERTSHQLGYPCYLGFDYGALSPLLSFSINNLGDPFIDASYGIHSRQFEVAVLNWFARLWELEENENWGYVTSCGSEGNFHGILIGRELFSNGVLYASRESHYSVFKAARLFRMDCVKVKTLVSGEIDYSDFKAKLLQNKGRPAIVNVNIGTTVKAAIDDLDLVINILEESGFTDRFYIHCDGALLGLMLPFMNQAPKISFKKSIGSVSISGHKFLGSPLPCGVQITRMSHIKALSRKVECIGSEDTTIMGSRNGHAPILLWYALSRRGRIGLQKEVERCIENAKYLKNRLRREGIGAMLNEFSNTVVFERPRDEKLVRKWQLLCEGRIAHIVVMPNVNVETLSLFVSELVQSRLVLSNGGVIHPPCIAAEVGDKNCGCFVHLNYYMGK